MTQKFQLYLQAQLPRHFKYPRLLEEIAAGNLHLDLQHPWRFIDADSEVGELAREVTQSRGAHLIPFASREDDCPDIACFDATDTSGNPPVQILVLEDSAQTNGYQDFAAWLSAAQANARDWQAWVQKQREAWLKVR